jgi:hypothetical protein
MTARSVYVSRETKKAGTPGLWSKEAGLGLQQSSQWLKPADDPPTTENPCPGLSGLARVLLELGDFPISQIAELTPAPWLAGN